MTEVEKMRSSQLADMSAPELQVRFEHAKKLLARMRGMSTYDEVIENYWISWYRGFLKLPLYARLSIAITETESSWVNMCLLMPIALSWMEDISQLVLIHWSVLVCRFIRLIIRWIIRKEEALRNMLIR